MIGLEVYIKDCYGIGSLEHNFSFARSDGHTTDEHKQTNIIYAHNGTMKTSFAKVFDDYSKGIDSRDFAYDRTPVCHLESNRLAINPKSVFVVHSHGEYFESEKMMTLLADKEAQQRYVEIMDDINASVAALFDEVTRVMGERDPEKTKERFDAQMNTNANNRVQRLVAMKDEVATSDSELLRVSYRVLDDPKVAIFLEKASTHEMLRSYVATYSDLMAKSKYFTDQLYDYSNAFNVQKSIDKNHFMKAKNRVVLVDKDGGETQVATVEELEELYDADKSKVFEDLTLKAKYEKFDKEIGANEQLRDFQKWVKKNQDFIPRLQTYKAFKRQAWYTYFAKTGELYEVVLEKYESQKDELAELVKKSQSLKTRWQSVVDRFNQSFSVPFEVRVVNQKDVILDKTKPALEFIFRDRRGSTPKIIPVEILNGYILSKGESRALFILCVMFEIESRVLSGEEHLIVLDDVADSFDYKNKYAIIEYLHGISQDSTNGIHMILMTHNFDFFRAFRLRCNSKWSISDKALIAHRGDDAVITLDKAGSVNEFDRLRDEAARDPKVFLSLIPFGRNITEYSTGKDSNPYYDKLTCCLHQKTDTLTITCKDIVDVLKEILGGVDLTIYETDDRYVDVLDREIRNIVSDQDEAKIEHKIVVSIGIRLKAEAYMYGRFVGDGKTLTESSYQTNAWFSKFKQEYGTETDILETLNKVMIVTPESIHFNSFMYEPIMDLSLNELVDLYAQVNQL